MHGSVLLIAAIAAYLHKMTGERHVVLTLPVAVRPDAELRTVPVMLSSALPLHPEVRPEESVLDLIRKVSREFRLLLRHQRHRGESLSRSFGLHPQESFLTAQVNIMSFDYDLEFAGHRAHAHNLTQGLVDDLSVTACDRSDGRGLRIDLVGSPEPYRPEELAAHRGARRTARRVPCQPRQVPRDHAARTVRRPGGTHPHGNGRAGLRRSAVTYRDLDLASNRLARLLIAEVAGPDRIVALAASRSADMVVALLGSGRLGFPQTRVVHRLCRVSATGCTVSTS